MIFEYLTAGFAVETTNLLYTLRSFFHALHDESSASIVLKSQLKEMRMDYDELRFVAGCQSPRRLSPQLPVLTSHPPEITILMR